MEICSGPYLSHYFRLPGLLLVLNLYGRTAQRRYLDHNNDWGCVQSGGKLFLIQLWGTMGAAISTLLSYIPIFVVRAIHTQTMLHVQYNIFKLLISVLILGIQCILVEKDVPLWPVFSSICLLLICAVHFKAIMSALRKSL